MVSSTKTKVELGSYFSSGFNFFVLASNFIFIKKGHSGFF